MKSRFFLLLCSCSFSANALAIEPFEWESAAPIEELIEEDSGSVKFYIDNPSASTEVSERIPLGYIPKNTDTRLETISQRALTGRHPSSTSARVDDQMSDRLKTIERRLNQPLDNNKAPASEASLIGDVSGAVKDGLGSLYRGIFSSPPDMAFGKDVREVAVIQSTKGYVPTRIDLIQGVKTRLHISGEVHDRKLAFVSDTLNIQRSVAGEGVTVVEFVPETAGMHRFYDPINKMEGWFLVR